jgi:hypothetical protein
VSPHRRTLQTACYVLQNHPQRENITLTLLPLAKEVMNNSNDLPIEYNELLDFIK